MKELPDWARTWRKVLPPSRSLELNGHLYHDRGGRWYHAAAPSRNVDGVRMLHVFPVLAPKVLKKLRRLERRGEAAPLTGQQKKLARSLRRKLERGRRKGTP